MNNEHINFLKSTASTLTNLLASAQSKLILVNDDVERVQLSILCRDFKDKIAQIEAMIKGV